MLIFLTCELLRCDHGRTGLFLTAESVVNSDLYPIAGRPSEVISGEVTGSEKTVEH